MLFEASSVQAWPPSWGHAVSVSETDKEAASEAPELSLKSLVDSVVNSLDYEAEKTAFVADGKNAITKQSMWRHHDAHPLVLMLSLSDRYGSDYLTWHPEVLKTTMHRDGIQLSNPVWNKIMAGRVVLNSPSPWRQWEVFHWTCRALNGETPNFIYLEKPDLGQMAIGYDVMHTCDRARRTGTAVDKFVAACLRDDGQVLAPAPLDFATRELEDPKLRCKSCDAIHRDDNDIRCVTCGSTELKRIPFDFAALKAETESLWAVAQKQPLDAALAQLPDTVAGHSVYRLCVAWDTYKTAKANLVRQLRMIGG